MLDLNIADLPAAFDALTFLPNRTPETPDDVVDDWAATLAPYRDGGVFIVHYAGNSQWERHTAGDEIVIVLEGSTTMFLLDGNDEVSHTLGAQQMLIVPQGVWHRFETPDQVKVMTVTPQPTEHTRERPTA